MSSAAPNGRRFMRSYRLDGERIAFDAAMAVLAGVAVLFLVAPTLIVLMTSFTSSYSLKFPPDGFSLRWYAALLDARQMQQAALNSLEVAVIATALSVLLGTSGALAIGRRR